MANATVKSAKRRSDFLTAVPFMLPALIGLTVFVIAPGIRGIYLAFTSYDVFTEPVFISMTTSFACSKTNISGTHFG